MDTLDDRRGSDEREHGGDVPGVRPARRDNPGNPDAHGFWRWLDRITAEQVVGLIVFAFLFVYALVRGMDPTISGILIGVVSYLIGDARRAMKNGNGRK